MRVWRVVDRGFLPQAWTGAGARLHGGRWNEPGLAVVYCSDHPALAVLEVMAGGIRPADLRHWALLAADIPDEAVADLAGKGSDKDRAARWLRSGRLACRVPSRVVTGFNILLNPASPDWHLVHIVGEQPLDPRLWGDGT